MGLNSKQESNLVEVGPVQFHRLLGISFLGFCCYTLIHYLGGHPRAVVIHLIGTLFTGLIWLFGTLKPKHLRLAGHIHLTTATATLSAHAWNGALTNDSAWFLILVPLFAGYLLGWRATVGWVAAVTLVLVIMASTVSDFGPEPEWLFSRAESRRNQILLAWLVSIMGVASARSLRAEIVRSQTQADAIDDMNQKLNQANKALAQRNEDLKLFASAASHDLQAPIRRSKAFLDLIREHDGDQVQEWFEHLDQQLGVASTLVSDLLDYATLESKLAEPEDVDTSEIFEEIKKTTASSGKLVLPTALPVVCSQRALLAIMLTNLVENGFKYNKSPSPEIQISFTKSEQQCTFHIKDNGIGIAEKNLKRIFEPFERLHSSAKYSGSGLGLAICKRVADMIGADISAQSEPGQGSTFQLVLPCNQDNSASDHRSGASNMG